LSCTAHTIALALALTGFVLTSFHLLLQEKPTLYALWPDGTCAHLGLEGAANTSITTMLHAMVNASNAPALAAVLNKRLDNITQVFAGNGTTASATSQVRRSNPLHPVSAIVLSCASCMRVSA
jgi:hypothetical protein